jgi:sugar lactone lactonase YvrE
VAIDAAGNVWVANAGGGVGLTELNPSGGLAGHFASSVVGGADGLAIDASGNVWLNAGGSVVEIVGAARPVLTPLVACLKQSPPSTVCLP